MIEEITQREFEKLEKEINEIFERLRGSETSSSEMRVSVAKMQEDVAEFKDMFKRHDINEMRKYDDINKNMESLSSTLIEMKEQNKSLDSSVSKIEHLIEVKEHSVKQDIENVDKKAQEEIAEVRSSVDSLHEKVDGVKSTIARWSGGIATLLAIGSIVWMVYATGQADKAKLEERLRAYEKNQFINYGRTLGAKDVKEVTGSPR